MERGIIVNNLKRPTAQPDLESPVPSQSMYKFEKSNERWWQKPLVKRPGIPLPAELVILHAELRAGETGAWLNSRSRTSGVINLTRDSSRKLRTVRVSIPEFASAQLNKLYEETGLRKGAPDLVIWHTRRSQVRFIEVKCPHWDRPSNEQKQFQRIAASLGIAIVVVEWEFCPE